MMEIARLNAPFKLTTQKVIPRMKDERRASQDLAIGIRFAAPDEEAACQRQTVA